MKRKNSSSELAESKLVDKHKKSKQDPLEQSGSDQDLLTAESSPVNSDEEQELNSLVSTQQPYSAELIDVFGSLEKILKLPELDLTAKQDDPDNWDVTRITPADMKGHKIMRGQSVDTGESFVAFCVKVKDEKSNSTPAVLTAMSNSEGLTCVQYPRGDEQGYFLPNYLTRLLKNEPCGKIKSDAHLDKFDYATGTFKKTYQEQEKEINGKSVVKLTAQKTKDHQQDVPSEKTRKWCILM